MLVPHNTPLVAPSCRWLRIEATASDLKVETKLSPPFLSIETIIGFCIGNFLQRALACSQVLIYLQKNLNAGGHFLCLDRKMVTSSHQSACAVTSCERAGRVSTSSTGFQTVIKSRIPSKFQQSWTQFRCYVSLQTLSITFKC